MLDEPAWLQAAVLAGFTEYDPVEGIPSEEPTEVLVFYAPDAIYFGIRAYDSRPELIPAQLGQRDRTIFNDDWLRIMLDTFNDQRQAFLFYVNPLGLQTDGLWIEGLGREGNRPPVDLNPDFIWDSFGRVTEEGWVAEIRIPYVSIQLQPAEVQTWGFNVAREVRRTGVEQSWAPLTKNRTSTLGQSGRLTGFRGLTAKKLVEITPVATGKLEGARDGESFVRESPEPQFGLDGRYGITRNLTLGATINPDFSQVEADADQITVNERFAIFFPEKRPFFLDGTEVFETPTRLVHTRQIVDPIGGAKLTGKAGPLNIGYLGALDRSPVQLGRSTDDALFNLARLRADVGSGSTVGALYTDRTIVDGSEYNRVAAVDTRLLFGGRYSLTAQVAGAWTKEGVEDASRFGPLVTARFTGAGRKFSWDLQLEDVHPDFETESGFVRRTGDLRARLAGGPTFFRAPGSTLQSVGFQLSSEGFWNHRDFWSGEELGPFEAEVQLQTNFQFRGNRGIFFIIRDGYFRFREGSYDAYEVAGPDGEPVPFEVSDPLTHMLAGGFFTRWRVSNAIQLGGSYFFRETPIFAEASRGRELLLRPSLNLRPTPSMQLDLSYAISRIWRSDGSFFSSADIPRLRFQYQFTRALFTRLVLQYDLQERAALLDPTTGRPILIGGEPVEERASGDFLSQVLIAYEPSPRTVIFLGWSRTMSGDRSFSLAEMQTMTEGFFAKLSYLLRL